MKIILFGGSGVLGYHVVTIAEKRGHQVYVPTHSELPIENLCALKQHFDSSVTNRIPDVIINCAGKLPGSNPQETLLTNALGPWNLAAQGIRMVHMSTDCVFSGQTETPSIWMDSSRRPDPADIYGRSKLAGEVEAAHVLVVRGSFIDPKSGFLRWLLDAHGRVEAWMHATWNGSSARRMAEKLVELAEGERTGIVHVAADGQTVTKAWMVEYICDKLDLSLTIELVPQPTIYRALYPDEDCELVPVKQAIDELIQEIHNERKE